MKKKLLLSIFIGLSLNISAQSLELVKNVNPASGLDYAPPVGANFYEFNNKVYYVFNDGTSQGLMVTDGTADGTYRITAADVFVSGKMMGANGKLFFIANNGVNGNELWVTDGSAEGTMMLKDQAAGTTGGVNMIIGKAGTNILYSGHDGSYNSRIWISDGTEAGTKLFKDNLPSGIGTTINDKLYFFAGSDSGTEPWVSDGTADGTHMIKDIRPGFPSSNEGNGVTKEFIEYNSKVYFFATDATIAEELWETDGTDAGTKMAVDINLTGGSRARDIVVFDNKLYISAYVGYKPSERFALVATDGTQAGTAVIDTIFSANDIGFNHLTVFNNSLFLRDDHPMYGRELFKLSGNEIVLVKDIFSGQTYNGGLNFNTYADQPLFQIYNNSMFFLANISNTQIQLFKSDGTAQGTLQVGQASATASAGSYMRNWIASSIGVFVINNTVENGLELYKYSDNPLTGVHHLLPESVTISPNPVQSYLNINSLIDFEEVEVYDVLGSLKIKKSFSEILNVDELQTGIYLLKIVGKEGVYQTSLLKE